MPVFSLKKIPIPNEAFLNILLKLDGRSLHTARQVSKEWNSFIESQVLGTVKGRGEMERTLQHQWREETPTRSEFTIADSDYVLALTEELAVIQSGSLVNFKDDAEVPWSWTADDLILNALITKNVLLLVKPGSQAGKLEILAWKVHNKEKIFDRKLPDRDVILDCHNQQVMLGGNTRLEISGTTVIEISQTPLPGSLQFFSHPFYLTWGGDGTTLWKLDGGEVTRVGDLDVLDWPVFCPARDLIICCKSLRPDQIKVRVRRSCWCSTWSLSSPSLLTRRSSPGCWRLNSQASASLRST